MRPDEHADYEQWAGSTCYVIWEPESVGMEFVAQTGNPLPLRVQDVHAARAELESKGGTVFGDTLDTGVCHMANFADPGANQLMLHHRYAPYGLLIGIDDPRARRRFEDCRFARTGQRAARLAGGRHAPGGRQGAPRAR